VADSAAVAAGEGLSVTGTLSPGDGIAPNGDVPGAPGGIPGAVPGDIPTAGGAAGMPACPGMAG